MIVNTAILYLYNQKDIYLTTRLLKSESEREGYVILTKSILKRKRKNVYHSLQEDVCFFKQKDVTMRNMLNRKTSNLWKRN